MRRLTTLSTLRTMQEKAIYIPSTVGQLEAIVVEQTNKPQRVGIICHPNPLEGGTMHNKVVSTLERTIRELGLTTVRFNYRGVGSSDGSYNDTIGETQDVLSVIHWARINHPEASISLFGFSFGSYVSLKAAIEDQDIELLVSVAPAITHHHFAGLHPHCPWLVIKAEADELVSMPEVDTWLETLSPKPDVISFPETSHFFHGKLIELRQQLTAYLKHAYSL